MVIITDFQNLEDIVLVLVMGVYLICLIIQQPKKKTFNISVNDVFKRHLSRGHVSCILDVHF